MLISALVIIIFKKKYVPKYKFFSLNIPHINITNLSRERKIQIQKSILVTSIRKINILNTLRENDKKEPSYYMFLFVYFFVITHNSVISGIT